MSLKISKFKIESDKLSMFQTYLLSEPKVKNIYKEFDFYNIVFYKEENVKTSIVYLQYPKGNVYWYIDFEKYIIKHFIKTEKPKYLKEWKKLLKDLKDQIKLEFEAFKLELKDNITAKNVLDFQLKYSLRDYQAYDLCKFLIKYKYWDNRGLILSDPRTGKTRVALAASIELLHKGDVCLVICPKIAEIGWSEEISNLNKTLDIFNSQLILKTTDLNTLTILEDKINIRIISYDMFKRFGNTQIRQLTSKNNHIICICDELHRLRNFKTMQSAAIFRFKDLCIKDKVDLGIIGLTGTPAVKESFDVFGTLSLINDSKIKFKPYYDSFNSFKEYFYYCEDTSFGKIAKALKRDNELNFILQTCSVQTKQKELSFFKDYVKTYKKIELDMDESQKVIYDSVYETMEYDEDIDCQNKLVQLIRLQQICIDPFGLVSAYDEISPKLKWIISFAKHNDFKFIVACKKITPLKHLMILFDKYGINYTYITGEQSYKDRTINLDKFKKEETQCMLLQLDTGKESLTLPMAKAIIFLDRDFAQGFNEQAEARITPVDGKACNKLIIDLVMKHTKEEQIYQTLVVKKQSIDAINLVFKSKKGD